MTIAEFSNWIVAVFYILALSVCVTVFPWLYIKKQKDLYRLERNIKDKFEIGISLEPKDILALGKALGFGPINARKPIYNLLLDSNDKEKFEQINSLRKEIEKEEPFDDMPDEVKPTLLRLSKLVEEYGSDSDKHILLPVHKTLAKYVELESERDKFRTRSRWGTVITVVSIIMGAFSFYQSLKSPTIEQIEQVVNRDHKQSLIEKDNK
jgi:hypothetical protein